MDREQIVAVESEQPPAAVPKCGEAKYGRAFLMPGLTDAHLHLKRYSLSLQKIDCETDTKEECLRRVDSVSGKPNLANGF